MSWSPKLTLQRLRIRWLRRSKSSNAVRRRRIREYERRMKIERGRIRVLESRCEEQADDMEYALTGIHG